MTDSVLLYNRCEKKMQGRQLNTVLLLSSVFLFIHVHGQKEDTTEKSTTKVKLIIDTDGVTDDVRAITLAMQHPNAEVLAFTTVHGCQNVSQAVANVFRAQKANGVPSKIPIYKGCAEPLLRRDVPLDDVTYFFGDDGMGGVPKAVPLSSPNDTNAYEKEHAALALIRLTREHPDAVVVAIGPLTNLALALKLDPKFAKQPKKLVLMGGNYFGIGNVHSYSSAEYNFYGDPEAASIVLKEMECPMTIVPWEAFYLEGKDFEKRINFTDHMKYDTPLGHFLLAVTKRGRDEMAKEGRQYAYCDEIAVATAIDQSTVAVRNQTMRVSVELAGTYSRGQVVVDWINQRWGEDKQCDEKDLKPLDKLRRPITFVTSYNVDVVDQWMHNAVKNSHNVTIL